MKAQTKQTTTRLIIEMVMLYGLLPLILWRFADNLRAMTGGRSFIILILPLLSLLLFIYLRRSQQLVRGELLFIGEAKGQLRQIFLLYAGFLLLSTTLVWLIVPEFLFDMPRQHPLMLPAIWTLYPLLSVIPQTIIFRVFFVKRYSELFTDKRIMIVIGALCFGFGHILFNNWFAPTVTLFGGALFLWRYCKTESMLLCALEHALYGNWLFTVGLGRFIFAGQVT